MASGFPLGKPPPDAFRELGWMVEATKRISSSCMGDSPPMKMEPKTAGNQVPCSES